MVGPTPSIQLPSGPRTRSGLSRGSWLSTTTSSLVIARSVSMVVTPSAAACRNAPIVFSGANPRPPRWAWRSKAMAAEATALAAQIAQASDAIGDIGMGRQERRRFRREGLDGIDDEQVLRGTTHSRKRRGGGGKLGQRRNQSIGITRELDRGGIGQVLALARHGHLYGLGRKRREDRDDDQHDDKDTGAAALL